MNFFDDNTPRFRRAISGTAVALALAVTACGSDDPVVSDDEVGQEQVAASTESPDEATQPANTPVDDAASDSATDAGPDGVVQQTGPISVSGQPLPPYDQSIPDDAIGTASPVVEGENFDGTPITIGGPSDNPTMLVFLAHWCPHCNDEIPELIALEEAGELPEDLDVIGISTAVASDRDNFPPSEWIDDRDWPWPVMADDEAASAFGAFGGMSFPYTVVMDADGTVLARRAGQAPRAEIVSFLDDALA